MIDLEYLNNLTAAEKRDAYAAATALEKQAKELKGALQPMIFERMDPRQDENAMLNGNAIASLKKVNGGAKDTYKVNDPVKYAAWLDRVGAQLDGRRATTQIRYPKDECCEPDYLTMLVEQNEGQLPPGVARVKPRAGSIRVTFAPGVMDRLFGGDLTKPFTRLLIEGGNDHE